MKQKKVVFTNGVFDILHVGHIELLKYAKSLGGKLVVGINSDRTTKILKGKERPINNEEGRKKVLESIRYVDRVVIFDDTQTINIIDEIKPDIVVKGGEWTAEEVRKRDKIPGDIEVKICPLVKDYSTTNTIKKIKEAETWEKTGMSK
jgi:rfaE bifunctional protein nucleotidyltransferase chain/domain